MFTLTKYLLYQSKTNTYSLIDSLFLLTSQKYVLENLNLGMYMFSASLYCR